MKDIESGCEGREARWGKNGQEVHGDPTWGGEAPCILDGVCVRGFMHLATHWKVYLWSLQFRVCKFFFTKTNKQTNKHRYHFLIIRLSEVQRFYNILSWRSCGKTMNAKNCYPLGAYKYTYSFTGTCRSLIPKIYWQEYNKIFTRGYSFQCCARKGWKQAKYLSVGYWLSEL